MQIIGQIGFMVFGLAGWYGFTGWLGAKTMTNFSDFMFGPYSKLWDNYSGDLMPGWTNPVVIIMIIAGFVGIIPSFIRITHMIAAFIVALFLVRAVFMIFGAHGAAPITFTLAIYAVFAFGWLILASALNDRSIWLWFREKLART